MIKTTQADIKTERKRTIEYAKHKTHTRVRVYLCLQYAIFEEAFVDRPLAGFIDAREPENLLWNIERIVTNIFIPILNSNAIGGPTVTEDLRKKVKNELLPCLRSFTR